MLIEARAAVAIDRSKTDAADRIMTVDRQAVMPVADAGNNYRAMIDEIHALAWSCRPDGTSIRAWMLREQA